MYMVVNKWNALLLSGTSQYRNSSQAEPRRPYDLIRAIRPNLCFLLRDISIIRRQSWVKLTCCIETNSASIATRVPGRGNSSTLRVSCWTSFSSRFLHCNWLTFAAAELTHTTKLMYQDWGYLDWSCPISHQSQGFLARPLVRDTQLLESTCLCVDSIDHVSTRHTFHLSGKLRASRSDTFWTAKSLNMNQGLSKSLRPSASGTIECLGPNISGTFTLAFDNCYEVRWLRFRGYSHDKSLRII